MIRTFKFTKKTTYIKYHAIRTIKYIDQIKGVDVAHLKCGHLKVFKLNRSPRRFTRCHDCD